MRFQTVQLPDGLTHGAVVFRHYVTLDDGTVHFQDEELQSDGDGGFESARTPWVQVNTPHAVPQVVGLIEFGGMPMAIRADGQAYIWGQVTVDLPDTGPAKVDMWAPFMEKVPYDPTGRA